MIVEKATQQDVKALSRVCRETFTLTYREISHSHIKVIDDYAAEAFNEQQVTKDLKDALIIYYVAKEADKIIGYAKLVRQKNPSDLQTVRGILLDKIYLDKKYQKKGYGTQLLDYCIQEAKRDGYNRLWLGVWERNHAAIAFYKRQGFKKIGTHDWKFKNETHDYTDVDILMSLEL